MRLFLGIRRDTGGPTFASLAGGSGSAMSNDRIGGRSGRGVISYVAALVPLALLSVGCAVTATGPSRHPEHATGASTPSSSDRATEEILRQSYRDWHGTKHRLGGTGKAGIDCSAFVQSVYRDALGISLPRTTHALAGVGREVPRGTLRPGDLVFFKPTPSRRHVGIYLSRNEFVHASLKRGVVISEMDTSYWSKHYWTARRIALSF